LSGYTAKEENLIKRTIQELKEYGVPQDNYIIFESFDYAGIYETKEQLEKNGFWLVAPLCTIKIQKKELYIIVMSKK
jgi:hypothetical protein